MSRRRRDGELGVYTGSSRYGKTHQVKKRIKTAPRAIVWSVKESMDRYADTWRDSVKVYSLADLARRVRALGRRPGHLIYIPESLKDFEGWARCAFAMGIIEPCTVVAEELADVTTPAKAPDGWGNLVRQGLGYGINIYAVTQRPAESDKTIMGNWTFLHTHHMTRSRDRAAMAEEMDLPAEDIRALKKYQFIERWAGGRLVRG